MCAGSAQVTLVELRGSYYTGCKPAKANQHPNTKTTPKRKTKEGGSNLLRNSCGHGSRMRKGETGAMNSAPLSVHLVHQQADSDLLSLCLVLGTFNRFRRYRNYLEQRQEASLHPLVGGEDKLCTCNALAMHLRDTSVSSGKSQSSRQGGRRQKESVDPAPAPKRFDNGSNARDTPN